MEVKDVRINNARYLAEKYGRAKLAAMLGYEDCNLLNQLVGGHGSFGRRVAARFEKRLELGERWMETPHPGLWGKAAGDTHLFIDSVCEGLSPADAEYFVSALLKMIARK